MVPDEQHQGRGNVETLVLNRRIIHPLTFSPMKRILVPCDFSHPAINAFRLALDVAARAKGTIHLLHVLDQSPLYDSVLMPALIDEKEANEARRVKAQKEFDKLLSHQRGHDDVKITTSIAFGQPIMTILDHIQNENIDLVIMGSRGASGLKEYFIGSNAEKIVRSSPAPVLVVKDYFKGAIRNIAFPNTLDTENQDELIHKVKELQHFFNAHLHLIWINTPLKFNTDVVTYQRLNNFAKRFNLKDYTVHIFNYSNEEEGIIQSAKRMQADVIALGTHGRKGLSHLLNGSVAEDLVNHADRLIWTYTLKDKTELNETQAYQTTNQH